MIAPDAGCRILHLELHPVWGTRRLWSLWDMIDYRFIDFLLAQRLLDAETKQVKLSFDISPGATIGVGVNERIAYAVDVVDTKIIQALAIEEAHLTLQWIRSLISRNYYTYREIHELLERLAADIRSGCSKEVFFHYPRELAKTFGKY